MEQQLTVCMNRVGIRSRRELSRLTGIAHSTLDDIFAHPSLARGYQIRMIAEACGLSDEKAMTIFTERS